MSTIIIVMGKSAMNLAFGNSFGERLRFANAFLLPATPAENGSAKANALPFCKFLRFNDNSGNVTPRSSQWVPKFPLRL